MNAKKLYRWGIIFGVVAFGFGVYLSRSSQKADLWGWQIWICFAVGTICSLAAFACIIQANRLEKKEKKP
jgi:hypothetical protein